MTAVRRPPASHSGVIFDLDDTLYPHEAFVSSGFEALARHAEDRHGVPAAQALRTLGTARRDGFRGRELQVLCERHGLPEELLIPFRNVVRAHRPRLLLPDASSAALIRMRGDGFRMVILTNGMPSIQRAKVAALGVRALVHHVVYAEEHYRGGKPAPGPFREALRRLGVPARRTICVGDDPANDIGGARRLGMRTIRLRTAHAVVPPGPDADAVIDDLRDVARTARRLLEGAACDAA